MGERQGLEIRRPAAAAGGSAQNAAKRGQPTPLSLSLYSYSPLSSAAVRATSSKTRTGGGFSATNVNSRHRMNLGVGVEPVIADHDLALVGDVGSDPGNELQIIHRLQLSRLPAPPVANFARKLQKQEAVQRQDGPDHLFSHPLGLLLGPGFDLAGD